MPFKSEIFLDTQNVCCNQPKIQTMECFHGEMCPKMCQKAQMEWQTV